MAMPMMPAMHPRMDRELASVGGRTVVEDTTGEVHLAGPALLGKHSGGMTPVGIVMGHVVYGIALALLYSWIA
jgi:hypothetical protein